MPNVFESFKKSLTRLKEIITAPDTPANRDSTIQRFEFTYELAWKSIQKYLRDQNVIALTPRDCFMEAFHIGLITDDERWLQMGKDRNMTVHTYNEFFAEQVYTRVHTYVELFTTLEQSLETKIV